VIEVGPGTGNLTRHLLSTQAHVLAVEKDDTLIERLRDEFKQVGWLHARTVSARWRVGRLAASSAVHQLCPSDACAHIAPACADLPLLCLRCVCALQEQNLQLVHGDVLQINLQELIDRVTHAAEAVQQQQDAADSSSSSSSPPGQEAQSPQQRSKRRKVKVVANLPYNITKDFLVAMFPKGDLIAELSIMIQVCYMRRHWAQHACICGVCCLQQLCGRGRLSAGALA
jgi:16S rRNA A1518/A1519 N6-dimethyltransferase RsmA/KsgA/DIM1 with predicted DNA glycosylase/AP lyase activity